MLDDAVFQGPGSGVHVRPHQMPGSYLEWFPSFRYYRSSMSSLGEMIHVQIEEIVFFSAKMARKMTASNVSISIV